MNKTRLISVNFGTSKTGLSTVGYALYNKNGSAYASNTTTGVNELGTGTGIYYATISVNEAFDGMVLWTDGEASPKYAIQTTFSQLNAIQDETDHIRMIWNSMRNQGEQLNKLISKSKPVKQKEYDKELSNIQKMLGKIDGKKLPEVKIPAPIVNIPETKIPDYTPHFNNFNTRFVGTIKEVRGQVDRIAGKLGENSILIKKEISSLLSEMNKLNKEFSQLYANLKEVNDNISSKVKPADLIKEIFQILQQSENLKKTTEEYHKKINGLKLAGL